MPNSLRCKIKKFHYQNKLSDAERDRLLDALDVAERKTGRWIPHDCLGKPSIDNDVCSECGQRFYQIAETGCTWFYCPNCGSQMEVEHE